LINMVLPALLFAQSGKVFDNRTLKSSIFDSERKFAINFPPDYDAS
jgi:hypothetical protein